jgi:hypothetical protein
MTELEALKAEVTKLREEIDGLRRQLVFDSSRQYPPAYMPVPVNPQNPPPSWSWPTVTCDQRQRT